MQDDNILEKIFVFCSLIVHESRHLHSYNDDTNKVYNKLILIRCHPLVVIVNTVRCLCLSNACLRISASEKISDLTGCRKKLALPHSDQQRNYATGKSPIVLAHSRPACGNQQVHKWQSRGAYMAVNRHRSGPFVAINRHIHGSQQAHTWQSTGTYMAINRHIHGSQQAHTWQSTGTYMAVNRHIHGNQQAHTWQSTGTYMAVNRHIHGNQQAHTWQSTGTYMAVNRHIHGNQQAHTWQSTGTYMAVNKHIHGNQQAFTVHTKHEETRLKIATFY